MTTTETAEGGRPMWHSLPITDIRVGERFREELGEIEKLKESIATYGLFHPVVIDRNFSLLAGFRRLVHAALSTTLRSTVALLTRWMSSLRGK